MTADVAGIVAVHLFGEPAIHPPVPCSSRHAALFLLAHEQCAASSRLASHADHGTARRIQLRFLGSNRDALQGNRDVACRHGCKPIPEPTADRYY